MMNGLEQLREITEDMCNNYCKYNEQYDDDKLTDEAFGKICANCPLAKLY